MQVIENTAQGIDGFGRNFDRPFIFAGLAVHRSNHPVTKCRRFKQYVEKFLMDAP